ncbi:MAG: ACP phosphodiesterase [Bacteroidia bacterium]
MNFLSHLYLSGDSEGIIIGNFIADSVKGSNFSHFPEDVQKGIILHRKIDTFTDTHSVVELSKERLRGNYKKYAGVIVDIYYDHFLAKNWKNYSTIGLEQYTQWIYNLVRLHYPLLPEKSAQFAHYMIQYNILFQYSRIEGVQQVFNGMARRAAFQSNMEYAVKDLQENYLLFEEEFKLFFPELEAYISEELKK